MENTLFIYPIELMSDDHVWTEKCDSGQASLLIQPFTSGKPFAKHISFDINKRLLV